MYGNLHSNMILTERDARAWVAEWVASEGRVRKGVLTAVIDGLQTALSIMIGARGRYPEAERLDTQEAISYLTYIQRNGHDSYPPTG